MTWLYVLFGVPRNDFLLPAIHILIAMWLGANRECWVEFDLSEKLYYLFQIISGIVFPLISLSWTFECKNIYIIYKDSIYKIEVPPTITRLFLCVIISQYPWFYKIPQFLFVIMLCQTEQVSGSKCFLFFSLTLFFHPFGNYQPCF